MPAINKHPAAITVVICTIALFLFASPALADPNTPADRIRILARQATQTVEAFMQQSLELRLKYLFFGELYAETDNQKLHKLATQATNQLQQAIEAQQKLKQQIEDYQGPDWDIRYGETGLWRRLFTDLYAASLGKCRIDLYRAVSSGPRQRKDVIRDILAQTASLDQIQKTPHADLLKAETLALLSRDESRYQPLAEKQLTLLEERYGLNHSVVLKTTLERIKLLGPSRPNELDELTRSFAMSSFSDNTEIAITLASLRRKYDLAAFKNMLTGKGRLRNLIGSFLLADLALLLEKQPSHVTTFDAELAVLTAWKDDPGKHRTLLKNLTEREQYRTPLILYVLAVTIAQDEPSEAVTLLIKASQLWEKHEKSMLEIPPAEIAAKAAHLACALPNQNQQNCPVAIEAFDNYRTIAGEELDDELVYLHTVVLTDCRKTQEAKRLLQQIADRGQGKYSNRAALDLIILDMQQPIRQPQRKQQLLEQLKHVIEECSDPNRCDPQLRTDALAVYCSTALESADSTSARKVLDIITEPDTACDPNLLAFKSRALMHLGRLGESAQYMAAICSKDRRNNHIFGAESLLRQIIDNIDQLQQSTDEFQKLVTNSRIIARHCYKVATTTYGLIPVDSAGLYLSEISIFAWPGDRQKLSEIEQLLAALPRIAPQPGPDLIRCRARLLMAQDKSEDAAKLWAQLAEIHSSAAKAPNTRTPKWWRAKYFQLYCSCTPVSAKNIVHTIDVLQNSFTDVPPFWAEKLDSLKRRCEDAPVRGHSASYSFTTGHLSL